MERLIVLFDKDPKNPINTWSGTSYSLLNALKKLVDVIYIDSSDTGLTKVFGFIVKKIGRRVNSGILWNIYSFLRSRNIQKLIGRYNDLPVLEISDTAVLCNPFYIYIDLSYLNFPYIKKRKIQCDSGQLRHVCPSELDNRIKWQTELFNKSQCIFTMGNWVAQEINDYYNLKARATAVGGGLNNEFSIKTYKHDSSGEKAILFVGVDFNRKGGELLLKAFQILRKKINNALLYIAGPDDISCNIDGVVCLGKLSRCELEKYWKKATIFCMPSSFEAYGLVFIEALCFGLPIVAKNDFEMKYFVENGYNGYLIDNDDPEELAVALNKALYDINMQRRAYEKKEEYKEIYSWDNVAQKIVYQIFNV